MTSQKLAHNWLQKARKLEHAPRQPNSIPIICDATEGIIRSRKRLKKLAPRLFDRDVVRLIVARRLQDLQFRLKLERNFVEKFGRRSRGSIAFDYFANASDPGAAAEAKIREDLASEAWAALSPAELAKVRFQWRLCELFWEILSVAMNRVEEEKQAGQDFRLAALTRLMVAGFHLERSEHAWLPALPKSLTDDDLPSLRPANAANGEIIPFPAAPDEKSNHLLAKARSLQESLGLKQAA